MEQDKIIVLDQDDTAMEGSQSVRALNIDPRKSDIDIKEDPQSVFQFMRRYDQKKLIIDPDFQRNLVWSRVQKSQFIESILLNYPLPPIYVNQNHEGNFVIIDGLQRTTAMHQFIHDEFPLTGLEVLVDLNDKYFSDLDDLRSIIEDKKLNLYILKPTVPLPVIYDLFNRINTGGTVLNRQEIRNCLYIGTSTRLLKKLAELEIFKAVTDNGISATRMKDREAVLRFLAFAVQHYENYDGDMSGHLERAMKIINAFDEAKVQEVTQLFIRVMGMIFNAFGDTSFRIPTQHTRGSINLAVLESVGSVFLTMNDDFYERNKSQLRKNYKQLISDSEYIDAVKYSTNSKQRVNTRFNRAKEILQTNCR